MLVWMKIRKDAAAANYPDGRYYCTFWYLCMVGWLPAVIREEAHCVTDYANLYRLRRR
jgi:hypothetical protein